MKPYHKNPRRINDRQLEDLTTWLAELGDLSGIVHDLNSDEIIGGNQRSRIFDINACETVLVEELPVPDEQGTVAFGYVLWQGKKYAYRQVRWTERQAEQANIVANRAGGEWDFEILASDFEVHDLLAWGFDPVELGIIGKESKGEGEGGDPKAAEDLLFTREQIIDAAFAWFRVHGFPYRNLAPHVSMQEINKLSVTEPDKLMNSNTAYHVADTYHPHRFHVAAEGMRSPFEAFADDRLLRRAMANRLDIGVLPSTYFTSLDIVSGTQAASNFRPGFAAHLYRRFCSPGATVLDTSTGYGGRLVGFIGSGMGGLYIGIDPNPKVHEGNLRMADELGFADRIELHNLPSEDVPHEVVAGRCDFAFTSPPYFRKEHYSEDDTQSWKRYPEGEQWRCGFLFPMLKLQYVALKSGCMAIINVEDVKIKNRNYPLIEWTIEAALEAGFSFIDREEFVLQSRFGSESSELETEAVLIFRKA